MVGIPSLFWVEEGNNLGMLLFREYLLSGSCDAEMMNGVRGLIWLMGGYAGLNPGSVWIKT